MSERNLTVKFNADTSGFLQGIDAVKTHLKELEKTLEINKRKQAELSEEIKRLNNTYYVAHDDETSKKQKNQHDFDLEMKKQALEKLQAEYKKCSAELKFTKNAIESLTESQKNKIESDNVFETNLKSLNRALIDNQSEIKAVKKEITEYQKIIDGVDTADFDDIEMYQSEIDKLKDKLAGLETYQVSIKKSISEAKKEFRKSAEDSVTDAEKLETATKKTETLSEKYKRLNGLLEENQKAIKSVNDEIEQAMDSGDEEHLKELQDKLKDLNSENTALQSRIKSVKDEIEKDANAIADAIENVESSMQMLQKAEKEVSDNGKLSLNTLNSIQKKYPELIDLTNQYIEGVKTEKDVIAGLKEVYEKDADNYNQALAFKKLKQDSYNSEFASASAELVNKYQEHYGIDLKNFISVNEAKKAAQKGLYDEMIKQQAEYDRLFANVNYKVIHNVDRGQADYQEYEYYYYDILKGWRAATDEEIQHFKDVQQTYFDTVDNYYDFDENEFQRQLEADLKKYYNPVSADSLLKFSNPSNTTTEKSKTTATTTKQDDKKQIDEYQEKLNLAKAAYEKLISGRIELLQKEAQAAKDTANAEIAALDRVLAKRKQARTEEDRQKKIDYINAQLRYKQLDDFSRKELQRQKQDLLSEQADYLFEQNISAKKDNINSRLDLAQNKSQQAINGLNSAKSQFADHIAYLSGNQTYDQRVANNTTNQNVQIIQNGLNGDQVVAKLLKALGAV